MAISFKDPEIASSFTPTDPGGQAASIIGNNPLVNVPNDYNSGPNGFEAAFYMSQPLTPQPAMRGLFEDTFPGNNTGGPPTSGGTQPSMTDSQVSSSFTPTLK